MFWDVVDSHAPTKRARVRRKCPPWIAREIRILMRPRSYYHKKAKKSKKPGDCETFKCIRNQLKCRLRKAKRDYFMVLSKESAHSPKKAWQEVNRLLGRCGRRETEVLKTEIGEMTDKQGIQWWL